LENNFVFDNPMTFAVSIRRLAGDALIRENNSKHFFYHACPLIINVISAKRQHLKKENFPDRKN